MEKIRQIELKKNTFKTMGVISSSIAMFIWGFILALAPLTTEWPFVPRYYYMYLLVAPPTSLLAGNMVMGFLIDRFGRKKIFVLDLILFSISIPMIILSNNVIVLIIGIGLAEFSLGGDENTILAYLSEMTPKGSRGRVIVFSTNMANFGALIAALLSLATGFSLYVQKLSFALLLTLSIPAIAITRFLMPESFRWEYYKKREGVALKRGEAATRLYFLVSMAITIVLTYALMGLVIGPYLFPNLTSYIILLYNLGETIGGFILLSFIDAVNRKLFAFSSYLGGTITMALFIPQFILMPRNLIAFMVLLFLNGLFGEFGWATRVIMEPELFPTKIRGIGIGLVRSIAYSLYIASIFFTASFSYITYIVYNFILWAVGLSGSSLWLKHGINTTGKALEEISDRVPVKR
ncbi:MAG: MFS transporter [Caldisphaeraceae archaeon]|nr:MFS transporter [Caldisphaeraceae archaeon]